MAWLSNEAWCRPAWGRTSARLWALLLTTHVCSIASAQAPAEALSQGKALAQFIVVPPKDSSRPHPVVVMLHGRCGRPERVCPLVADAFTEQAWLVCPRGDSPCSGGGATWSRTQRVTTPVAALNYVRHRFPSEVDESKGHWLAGFSLGAFAAVDAFNGEISPFSHLIVIGAKVEPQAPLLRKSGIKDVVLMAGRWDMMYTHMQQKSAALTRLGYVSRFVDLGPVGHQIPEDMGLYLRDVLRWESAQ